MLRPVLGFVRRLGRGPVGQGEKKNGWPFTRPVVPKRPVVQTTVRQQVVRWARWGVANTASIHYREVRPMPLSAKLPLTTDCSGFVTLCYRLAGASDPNGLGYSGQGDTGTLMQHGLRVTKERARPGDIVVYGVYPGVHTAIVVEGGGDPLTVSHGQEGDPSYVRVSQDGRVPQTFISYL